MGNHFGRPGAVCLGIEDQYWHNKLGTDGGRDVAIHRDKWETVIEKVTKTQQAKVAMEKSYANQKTLLAKP